MVQVERRACQRFAVPGGTVAYQARLRFWRRRAERDCLLVDLSRGGVAFVALARLAPRTRVELEIAVPEEPVPLVVVGHVVACWTQSGGAHRLGVEFVPYGDAEGANPPAALERIRDLEARFTLTR